MNSLRAFEAVGRLLSFKKAAEELNVTPTAISQQVKLLEDYFGMSLFARLTRAITLTDSGQRLLPEMTEGFDKLASGVAKLRNYHGPNVLTVSVAPSFGGKWLVPRLKAFRDLHPNLDVRIHFTDHLVDFVREGVDVAIRYGRGVYKGLHSERLSKEVLFPVCSPHLTSRSNALGEPGDLRDHTLLHVDWSGATAVPIWHMWLVAAGVEGVNAESGLRFGDEAMAVQAAVGGHGVALASSLVVADDLKAGNLVCPFESLNMASEFSYFLVHQNEKLLDSSVQAFSCWLKGEFLKTQSDINRAMKTIQPPHQ